MDCKAQVDDFSSRSLLAPTAVHDILEHRIALSDMDLPTMGSHVLRHSLAVDLLRRTAVYLRLAADDLREVGLPVPESASATVPQRKG